MPPHLQYQQLRGQLRHIAYRESLAVIWAYSQYLQAKQPFPQGVEVGRQFLAAEQPQTYFGEWNLEQLTTEVIRHSSEIPRNGRTLRTWATFADAISRIKAIDEAIYAELEPPIHLEMMRMSHRQFVWQQHRYNPRTLVRYYKLFEDDQINEICLRQTGLSVRDIYIVGLALLGAFLESPRVREDMNLSIPGITRDKMDCFFAFAARDLAPLAIDLRIEHRLDEAYGYRYSSLRAFPLVRIRNAGQGELACPIPTLLFWRITSGLYYNLRGDRQFAGPFGASFQRYAGEVLAERVTAIGRQVLPEQGYYVGSRRKDTVDWIVTHDDAAALFIECKTMRLTWESRAGLSNLDALEKDVRKLAGAVVQTYRTVSDYTLNLYPNLPVRTARAIYPVVVTLEDWYLFGVELPTRLDVEVRRLFAAEGLPEAWLDEMPYAVMSADDFEKFAGVINGADMRTVMDGKLRNAARRGWGFGNYCDDAFPDIALNLDMLFRADFDAIAQV